MQKCTGMNSGNAMMRTWLDVDDELRVEVREPGELVLVQVHEEDFVRRGQIHSLARELPVKVADVFPVFLQTTMP